MFRKVDLLWQYLRGKLVEQLHMLVVQQMTFAQNLLAAFVHSVEKLNFHIVYAQAVAITRVRKFWKSNNFHVLILYSKPML